jgi:hypothetical protein
MQLTESYSPAQVEVSCAAWMANFFKSFDPKKVRTYALEQLYKNDVAASPEMVAVMRAVNRALWSESGKVWTGNLLEGWRPHSQSLRTRNLEHPSYPGFIFKFCSDAPGRGIRAAHFLRVPKGKELKQIVQEEGLDELEIVDEKLIALKPLEELENIVEQGQCFEFVVASRKLTLFNEFDTICKLEKLPQAKQAIIATQIMRLICRSGLGDVGFHNIFMNKETRKLVFVDTEPLWGSLILDVSTSPANKYQITKEIMQDGLAESALTVLNGLNKMIQKGYIPVFVEVAKIYKKYFCEALQLLGSTLS